MRYPGRIGAIDLRRLTPFPKPLCTVTSQLPTMAHRNWPVALNRFTPQQPSETSGCCVAAENGAWQSRCSCNLITIGSLAEMLPRLISSDETSTRTSDV